MSMGLFAPWRSLQFLIFLLFLVQDQLWAKGESLPIISRMNTEVRKEQASKLNLSLPNYDLYHRSDVFQNELRALVDRHPQIMSMDVLQAEGLKAGGDERYSAEMTVVTVEAGGTGTGFGFKQNQNMRLLLNFGQHGRELVTSEAAFRLLRTLGGEHPLGNVDTDTLFRVLPHTTIKIIPIENLNGRKRVEAGYLCERKNGRGVDPNRNWGVDWGKKEKDYDPSEEFPGMAAFSEPETKILRELAESFRPHVWVNVHSGMEALFMPYDHKDTVPDDGALQMSVLLQKLNKRHCEDNCVVGSGGGSVGYLAHGTATDYMYDALRVPMAFTWEIYGDATQPESDCFQMFNPATASKLEGVLSKWSSLFLTLITNLPRSLHSLKNRSSVLEVWDWESWPVSAVPSIPDFELRSRFPLSTKPLFPVEHSLKPFAKNLAKVWVENSVETFVKSDRAEWMRDRKLERDYANTRKEDSRLLLECFLLLALVVLFWLLLRFFRKHSSIWDQISYISRFERRKRVPV